MHNLHELSFEASREAVADFHQFVIAEHANLSVEVQRLLRTVGELEFLTERALFAVVPVGDNSDDLRTQPVVALFASESLALRVAERVLDLFSLYLLSAHENEQILTADIGIENLAVLWDRYQNAIEKRD